MVFPRSMADMFAEFVPDAWLDQMFAVTALAWQHTFQVLTKRPPRRDHIRSRGLLTSDWTGSIRIAEAAESHGHEMTPGEVRQRWPLPNVWLGTSAEDQAAASGRGHILGTVDVA